MAGIEIARVVKAYGATPMIHGIDIDIDVRDGDLSCWSGLQAAENRPSCA